MLSDTGRNAEAESQRVFTSMKKMVNGSKGWNCRKIMKGSHSCLHRLDHIRRSPNLVPFGLKQRARFIRHNNVPCRRAH